MLSFGSDIELFYELLGSDALICRELVHGMSNSKLSDPRVQKISVSPASMHQGSVFRFLFPRICARMAANSRSISVSPGRISSIAFTDVVF